VLFGLLGISFGPGWLGYLIAGFVGAVILIFVARQSDALRSRAFGISPPGVHATVRAIRRSGSVIGKVPAGAPSSNFTPD
jgi:hypothetical protein